MGDFTLEQLRTFVAVVETGSFSAAGRRLSRVQSAVSTAVGNLEQGLGQQLFDRNGRTPKLTRGGERLLSEARRLLEQAQALEQTAWALGGGVEPQLRLVADSLLPLDVLVEAIVGFHERFASVDLCVSVENLGAPSRAVAEGRADLGISGPTPRIVPGVEARVIGGVRLIPVVHHAHPLARTSGSTPLEALRGTIQITLTSSDPGDTSTEMGVLSDRSYRVSDFATKLAFILGGLGWGNLPEHLARPELASGKLVRLDPEAWDAHQHWLPLSVVQARFSEPGPATRWLIEALSKGCSPALASDAPSA
jgi:DNA-binding transcriptional LysR family regulator